MATGWEWQTYALSHTDFLKNMKFEALDGKADILVMPTARLVLSVQLLAFRTFCNSSLACYTVTFDRKTSSVVSDSLVQARLPCA